MKTITAMVDAAKGRLGIKSDRELAKHLNLGANSNITRWRNGTMPCSDEHVFRLAEGADIDAQEALRRVRLEEETLALQIKIETKALRADEPARSVYRQVSREMARALATIGCLIVLLTTTSAGAMPVEHTGNSVPLEARNLYIMRLRRRIRDWIRSARREPHSSLYNFGLHPAAVAPLSAVT